MIVSGSIFGFLQLALSCKWGQKLGKPIVTVQVLTVLIAAETLICLSWLFATECVGHMSALIYGLAIVHLCVHHLGQIISKHFTPGGICRSWILAEDWGKSAWERETNYFLAAVHRWSNTL